MIIDSLSTLIANAYPRNTDAVSTQKKPGTGVFHAQLCDIRGLTLIQRANRMHSTGHRPANGLFYSTLSLRSRS